MSRSEGVVLRETKCFAYEGASTAKESGRSQAGTEGARGEGFCAEWRECGRRCCSRACSERVQGVETV